MASIAVQFHPEVLHTPGGTDMLRRFVLDACKAPPTWTTLGFIEEQLERIRDQVGDHRSSARSRAGSTRRLPRCSYTAPWVTS